MGARGEACMHAQHSCCIYSPLICRHTLHGHGDLSMERLYIHSAWKDIGPPQAQTRSSISKPYMANRVQQMLCRLGPMTYKSLS